MAAASTHKFQDIVECPICLETLTEPRMLACFHFYCQKCVHDMKEVKQSHDVGYECPVCRKFTAKNQLQSLPIMTQLMEAMKQASVATCGKCKKQAPIQRCLDCKESYCDACRDTHNEFKLFQSHAWEAIGDTARPIIDEIVFCRMHQAKPAELYCRDCKQLICLLCNGTTHKTHSAETVEEALQQILPAVREKQLEVKAKIECTQACITEAKHRKQETEDMLTSVSEDLEAKYEKAMNKLKADYAELSDEIKSSQAIRQKQQDLEIHQLELKLQSQENVMSLSQSTLDTAQNISLLKALQSGVLDSLNGTIAVSTDTNDSIDETIDVIELQSQPIQDQNLIGTLVTHLFNASNDLETSCDDILKKEISLQSSINMNAHIDRFEIFKDEIWCVENRSKNIHIYARDGTRRHMLTYGVMQMIRSINRHRTSAVAAAKGGLYTITTDQNHSVKQVHKGNYCDVSINSDTMYALTCDASNQVKIFRYAGRTCAFERYREFKLEACDPHYTNTITASSDKVFVALRQQHAIQQYSTTGRLQKSYTDINSPNMVPSLSGVDSAGNILISDFENHRLVVLKADGSIHTVPVQNIGRNPTCARVNGGLLYVSVWEAKAIQVFTA